MTAGCFRNTSRAACAVVVLTCMAAQCGSIASTPDPPAIGFTDVTSEAGLSGFRHLTGAEGNMWMPETVGGGGGFIDYDGDGLLDVILVRGSTWEERSPMPSALALFANDGAGGFVDRTVEAGLDDVSAYAFGVTVADYDNDGDDDFYVTALRENMLFRNDGGRFVEIGKLAGVAGPPEWSTAAVFLDADVDGRLDLFVGNYVKWSPETDISCSLIGGVRSYCTPDAYEGLGGRFYRNEGGDRFTERTEEAGFGAGVPGKTLAAASFDYNEDGYPDLVVVNDTERDLLYENAGDGTFREIGIISGLAFDRNGKARAGMGVDVGVIDSTNRPTVFVANFSREMVGAYQYAGGGRFVDRASQARLGQASMNYLTFGLFVFDADLDGHLDLLTANGHINPNVHLVDGTISYRQPVRLYQNLGDGTFEPALDDDVFDSTMVARGAAYGDYDRDGDLDVLLVENGGPAHLWRNDAAGSRYLRVALSGRRSNRAGIGARIVAVAAGRRLTQFVRAGKSYLSSSEPTVTFGLGTAATVDSLYVYWPSGVRDTLADLDANQQILVTEEGGYDRLWPVVPL